MGSWLDKRESLYSSTGMWHHFKIEKQYSLSWDIIKWKKCKKSDYFPIKGGLSEEQFVHDPKVEHSSLPSPPRISHHWEPWGLYWAEDSLAWK